MRGGEVRQKEALGFAITYYAKKFFSPCLRATGGGRVNGKQVGGARLRRVKSSAKFVAACLDSHPVFHLPQRNGVGVGNACGLYRAR